MNPGVIGVVPVVETTSVEFASPPGATFTVAGLGVAVGPPAMEGMIDVVSVTGPEKPPRLWIVIWLECEEPWTTLKKMGLTSIVKSGTGPYETVIASVAEWVRERLVPFTSIRYVPQAV